MLLVLLHLYYQYHLTAIGNLRDLNNLENLMVKHRIHPNVNARNMKHYKINVLFVSKKKYLLEAIVQQA